MANRKGNELTPGEDLFIEAYLSNGYDRKAASQKANFKTENHARYGGAVLKRPQVQEELRKRIEKRKQEFFLDDMDIKLALWEEAHFKGKGSTQSGRISALVALGKAIEMFGTGKEADSAGAKKGLTINITNYGKEEAKQVTGEVIDQIQDEEPRRLELNEND